MFSASPPDRHRRRQKVQIDVKIGRRNADGRRMMERGQLFSVAASALLYVKRRPFARRETFAVDLKGANLVSLILAAIGGE